MGNSLFRSIALIQIYQPLPVIIIIPKWLVLGPLFFLIYIKWPLCSHKALQGSSFYWWHKSIININISPNHLIKLINIDSLIICENLHVRCIWLYVIIMSRTSLRLNPHSIVAWMSRNSFLERGAISEV